MKAVFLFTLLPLLVVAGVKARAAERAVVAETVVPAPADKVWEAWTTKAGLESFFAPVCKIDLRVLGAFEIYFNPEGKPGERGAEGNLILAIQPQKMLSFTWDAPPHLPNIRQQRTSVVVRFKELGNGQTKVTLTGTGWGDGDEWDQAYAYFSSAWQEVVLPRLKYRFETGPVDWKNPPAPASKKS